MSKVLITGIGGFVGGHLIERLQIDFPEHSYFGFYYPGVNVEHLDKSISLFPIDITDSKAVNDKLDTIKPDFIVHLAAIAFVPHSNLDPLKTWEVNLTASLRILEWIRLNSKKTRIMVISTSEIYGAPQPHELPINEGAQLRPNNVYSATKASLDLSSGQYQRAWGLDIVICRPFNHIGPGQSPNFVVSSFAKQIARASLELTKPVISVGNLSAKRDFTDVRDVVRAYSTLLFSDKTGVFNICSSKPVAIQTILDTLIKYSEKKLIVEIDPKRLRKVDVPEVRGDYTKLHNQLNWSPKIPLEKTLKDTLDYWMSKIQS